MLRDLDVDTEYRTGEADLAEAFYRPCLQVSTFYDRAVGYFRSSVAAVYGQPIIGFARRGGRIRIVCSADLTRDDVAAISSATPASDPLIRDRLLEELNRLIADLDGVNRIRVIATLVAAGVLQFKVAVPMRPTGIFHEKLGVFVDTDGDAVSFRGSSNETWSGWHPQGNVESNEVFCSWKSTEQLLRVKRHRDYFQRLWEGHVPGLQVMNMPEAVERRLLEFKRNSFDELEVDVTRSIPGSTVLVPRAHQAAAIEAWHAAGMRGILEHATGSGKTITALLAARDHVARGAPVLVLIPSRILLDQWKREVRRVLPNSTILLAGGGNDHWREGTKLRSMTSALASSEPRITIAIIDTACTDPFRVRVSGGAHLLVVGDEVHQLGAPEASRVLEVDSGPRLGLSATPTRFGDPVGTQRILDYFGPVIFPPFTLRDAINAGALCEYEYFPCVVRLTQDEADAWRKLTIEIAQEIGKEGGSAVVGALTERAKQLLIRRARIAKKAEAKLSQVIPIIRQAYEVGQRWLIYCEDIDQLEDVVGLSKSAVKECSVYHSKMSADDRTATLDWFESSGGILVSVACLDEGVDIPAASHALILASSQNPRQFIQRRGRVLRKARGKHLARIFDVLVAPVTVQTQPDQASLLEAELSRAITFAKDAINPSAAFSLRQIAIDAGFDPDNVAGIGMED